MIVLLFTDMNKHIMDESIAVRKGPTTFAEAVKLIAESKLLIS